MSDKRFSKKACAFTRAIFVLLIISMIMSCGPINLLRDRFSDSSVTGNLIVGKMSSTQKKNAQELVSKSDGEAEVHVNNGVVQSVLTDFSQRSDLKPEEEIEKYFSDYADLYLIDSFSDNFSLVDHYDHEDGSQVFQYEQVYEGIPVYQADIRVSLDETGSVGMVNSNYIPTDNLPKALTPRLSPETASLAFSELGYEFVEGYEPELVIYSPALVNDKGDAFLAWHAKVVNDDFYGSLVIKDSDGSLVSSATDIQTFSYEIRDFQSEPRSINSDLSLSTYNRQIYMWPGDNLGTTLNYPRVKHIDEYFDAIANYLELKLNYTNFKNTDSFIRIAVNLQLMRNGTSIGPFATILDSDNKKPVRMIAFDFQKNESPIDVLAHEFQHIITSDFVKLENNIWHPQASALSEAFSDLFAAVMDYKGQPWQITAGEYVIRDIKNPSNGLSDDKSPNHMDNFLAPKKQNQKHPDYHYGLGHHNSTIVSHAFYLLSEGGSGPGKNPIQVQGIGIDNTYKIAFYSLARMNDNANFLQARNAMVNTCNGLASQGVLSFIDCNEVKNAFAAVGIGEPGRKLTPKTVAPTTNWFGMGSNTHMRSQNINQDYKEMASLGVQIVREDLPWAEIQTGIDTYDLNYRDGRLKKALSAAKTNGLKVLGILSYAPNSNLKIDSDTDFINLWTAYVQKVVDEYGDQIDYWEVGNDINVWWHKVRGKPEFEIGLYMKMLKSAYEIIKLKDPMDVVIMGSLVNTDNKLQGLDPFEMMRRLQEFRVQNYCDALNLQLFWPGQEPDEKKPNIVYGYVEQFNMSEYVKNFLNETERLLGKRMPLWITSVGYDMTQYKDLETAYGFSSDEMQAVFLIKSYVTLLSIPDVQSVFWYTWLNDETGQQFDLLEAGKNAYGTLTKALSGSQPLGRQPVVDVNGNVVDAGVDYRFKRPDDKIVSYFWATDGRLGEFEAKLVPGNNQTVKMYQPDGLLKDRTNHIISPEDFVIDRVPKLMIGAIDFEAKIVLGKVKEKSTTQETTSSFDIQNGFTLFYDENTWHVKDGTPNLLVLNEDEKCFISYYAAGIPVPSTTEIRQERIGDTDMILEINVANADKAYVEYVYEFNYLNGHHVLIAYSLSSTSPEDCGKKALEVIEISEANGFGMTPRAVNQGYVSTSVGIISFIPFQHLFLTYRAEEWKDFYFSGMGTSPDLISLNVPNCRLTSQKHHMGDSRYNVKTNHQSMGNLQITVFDYFSKQTDELLFRSYQIEKDQLKIVLSAVGFSFEKMENTKLSYQCIDAVERVIEHSVQKGFNQ